MGVSEHHRVPKVVNAELMCLYSRLPKTSTNSNVSPQRKSYSLKAQTTTHSWLRGSLAIFDCLLFYCCFVLFLWFSKGGSSGCWRLASEKTAEKIEAVLQKLVPRDDWTMFSHWLIWHGRRRCSARKPECNACEIAALCPSEKDGEYRE